jgi:hypothetical protein
MRPDARALHRLATVCVAFGLAGLAFTLVALGIIATGSADLGSPLSFALTAGQSGMLVVAGWLLRRRASA